MNRQRTCKIKAEGCQGKFKPFSTLQACCFNPKCVLENSAIAQSRRAAKEQAKAKEKIKPLSTVCAEAQKDVNRYIMAKARAEFRVCISCGSPDISDAGHFIHAGSKYRTSRLRFDHRNLEPQCQSCNRFKGGMSYEYSKGILAVYGQGRLDELDELKRLADSNLLEALTKDEVREIAAEHRRLAREIERQAA